MRLRRCPPTSGIGLSTVRRPMSQGAAASWCRCPLPGRWRHCEHGKRYPRTHWRGTNLREMPPAEELADPGLYQQYEMRQKQQVYASFVTANRKIGELESLIEQEAFGIDPEQLRRPAQAGGPDGATRSVAGTTPGAGRAGGGAGVAQGVRGVENILVIRCQFSLAEAESGAVRSPVGAGRTPGWCRGYLWSRLYGMLEGLQSGRLVSALPQGIAVTEPTRHRRGRPSRLGASSPWYWVAEMAWKSGCGSALDGVRRGR